MENFNRVGKLRTMLDLKLTVGQVISGAFITISSVVGMMTWSEGHFETKNDAIKREDSQNRRITKVEDSFAAQALVQTQIYGDVKEINGILKGQMAEKNARNGR